MTIVQGLPVRTGIHGRVPAGAREHAVSKVHAVLRHVAWPVLSARVTLTVSADPAVARPAMARAAVDVNGRVVRAAAAGQTIWEAIARMSDRLQTQLDRSTCRHRTGARRQGLSRLAASHRTGSSH